MAPEYRRRPRRALSMTSLIDVIFLLLLFFMLSSTFSRYGEISLTAATGVAAAPGDRTAFLSVAGDDLRLNGEMLDLAALLRAVEDARASTLLVSLSADVPSQRLIDVLAVLRPLQHALGVTVLE